MRTQFLAIIALLCLGAAARAEPSPTTLPGGAVLAIEGPGIAVQLIEVTDDRCPSTVLCVWEGTIRVVLTINPGGANAERLVLCNACDDGVRSGVVAGLLFTLHRLDPPVAEIEALGRPPVLADYAGQVTTTPAD